MLLIPCAVGTGFHTMFDGSRAGKSGAQVHRVRSAGVPLPLDFLAARPVPLVRRIHGHEGPHGTFLPQAPLRIR